MGDTFWGIFTPAAEALDGDRDRSTGESTHETANEDDEDIVEEIAFQGQEMTDHEAALASFGSGEYKNGYLICGPYKNEILEQQIENNSPGSGRRSAIVETLRDMGVKVFIVDGKSVTSTAELVGHLKRVVGLVSRENRLYEKPGPLGFQRCLLYQDGQGRVFNLLVDSRSIGPVSKWHEFMDTFSGLEAMIAVTILVRSFPCAVAGAQLEALKPAYLSLVLGLVLTEEISLSWLNASMFIMASPSVSAHTLTTGLGSDLLRKLMILILAASGAASGKVQRYATLVGIGLACVILLSNLGSRSWHFMGWKPQRYQGCGAQILAYLASIATGLVLPYMGHRKVGLGGSPAMSYVVKTALLVAIAFVISDLDTVQKFLVIGSERCNQNLVNITVGGWWFLALVSSLFMVRRIPKRLDNVDYDAEPVLVEDHASPVGYRVPAIPDFIVNPLLAEKGDGCVSVNTEFFVGLVLAFVVGAGMIYLSFTDMDERAAEKIENFIADL